MDELIAIENAGEMTGWHAPQAFPPLDPEDFARHAPDAHWVVQGRSGKTVGRCSLWWRAVPALPGHRLGIIGHYAAEDIKTARRLLARSGAELRARGCTLALGPMDGNTWRRYRFITERGSEPAFFLEPGNPDEWPAHFTEIGFRPFAHYFSAMNSDLEQRDPRLPDVAKRLTAQGITIRTLDLRRLPDELQRIYAVSVASFRNNLLYTPIDSVEFCAQYRSILPCIQPELVLLAERDEQTIGFIFAIPDLHQGRRGMTIDTVIIKTVAVIPERSHAGLGNLLVGLCQQVARDLGYKRAVHALMHESNSSRNISRRYAQFMRRYTLFALPLRESEFCDPKDNPGERKQ